MISLVLSLIDMMKPYSYNRSVENFHLYINQLSRWNSTQVADVHTYQRRQQKLYIIITKHVANMLCTHDHVLTLGVIPI